ncbi:YppG family protein [Neobacillus pocheonensis]|uniref:YppG family protein n=1 Tax=Neobacillus pocheonensis TaxID=363869 RepID=UPI003D274765
MFGKMRPKQNFHYVPPGQMMHQGQIGQQWNQEHFIRNQPYPYQTPPVNYNWNSYQQQNPYNPKAFQQMAQNYQPGYAQQNMPYPNQNYLPKDSQFLFQNPLQPQDDMYQQYPPMNGYPMMNPYPKQGTIPKQPGSMQSFMNSFKSQDGSVDFNKMMNTAGQMMNAVNQVSSLVKGFGGFFKA